MAALRIVFLVAWAAMLATGCGSSGQDQAPPDSQDVSTTATTTTTAPDQSSRDEGDDPLTTDDTSDSPTTGTSDESESPAVTQTLDGFGASTTANEIDETAINDAGTEIVDAWWFSDGDSTYSELADELQDNSLITQELADEWRLQGDQAVIPAPDQTTIVKMWPVRVAEDNATFQISALAEGEDEETLTFIEFELENGLWKAVGIQ